MNGLTENTLIDINVFCQKKTEHLVKSMPGVRDRSGLSSIAASVDQHVFGTAIYPTPLSKAAFLWRSITNYHCFYNGNKRTAFVAAYVYLLMSGIHLTIDRHTFYEYALRIAAGELDDRAIEQFLKNAVNTEGVSPPSENPITLIEEYYTKDEELCGLIEDLSLT